MEKGGLLVGARDQVEQSVQFFVGIIMDRSRPPWRR
jgi:hypothetical protein